MPRRPHASHVWFCLSSLLTPGCILFASDRERATQAPPPDAAGDAEDAGDAADVDQNGPDAGAEGGSAPSGSALCGVNGRNDCGAFLVCDEAMGCVECAIDAQCPRSAPVCVLGECGGCRCDVEADPHCAAEAPACWPSDHACHARCAAPSDCPSTAPICDGATGQCWGCQSDEDCREGVCSAATKTCVACRADADCRSHTPRCRGRTGTCEQCMANRDCGLAAPICDPTSVSVSDRLLLRHPLPGPAVRSVACGMHIAHRGRRRGLTPSRPRACPRLTGHGCPGLVARLTGRPVSSPRLTGRPVSSPRLTGRPVSSLRLTGRPVSSPRLTGTAGLVPRLRGCPPRRARAGRLPHAEILASPAEDAQGALEQVRRIFTANRAEDRVDPRLSDELLEPRRLLGVAEGRPTLGGPRDDRGRPPIPPSLDLVEHRDVRGDVREPRRPRRAVVVGDREVVVFARAVVLVGEMTTARSASSRRNPAFGPSATRSVMARRSASRGISMPGPACPRS